MEPGSVKVLPVTCCCCCCFWTLFTAIAIPLSFKSLEQGRYALALNWSTQQIGPDVISEPGLKAVGLGNSLVEFPATFQTLYFVNANGPAWGPEDFTRPPVQARSQDGLKMYVSISFQWRLQPSALHDLYSLMGYERYKGEFVRFARAGVVSACSHWGASEFFTNRSSITADIIESLEAAFKLPGLQVEIAGLQLREVDLPDDFDAEITRTQEEMQDVEVALAEREKEATARMQLVAEAEQRKRADITIAEGKAKAIEIENSALVDMMIELHAEVALSNQLILHQFMNDTDSMKRLFELMEVQGLNDHNPEKLLVNF
eukprot:TRINITY_DN14132_c0_g1_i1.p1 TRINITY_DN14132_c0_g1~~TRINITY_DN14132_c0_g1_i1.p1  ORF type:complete len:317 (+),score=101.55 TRINITY_DN14132_c0_g1_i1:174-1124(+)